MHTRHPSVHPLEILPLPAFQDNYIWLMRAGNLAAVVDPGDAAVVLRQLEAENLTLTAILLTHHHPDHVGGVAQLAEHCDTRIFGPADAGIEGLTDPLSGGGTITLPALGLTLEVLAVPGHTPTHIAYAGPGFVFPGDTLFSGGCGRLFGGTAAQMHASLQRLAALPDDTRVYSTHEYTLSNLRFAQAADPDNPDRDAWLAACERLRTQHQPTLPTTIAREKRINPFLRCGDARVMAAVAQHAGTPIVDPLACFAAMRAWKDGF
ncbi:MAG: hydroxyacylglutathione hydrolase [Rhodocyclaceae bacterium]|nr:hydroxyacylglutathione hydrolase [Rhodocyclaceae bacterium]